MHQEPDDPVYFQSAHWWLVTMLQLVHILCKVPQNEVSEMRSVMSDVDQEGVIVTLYLVQGQGCLS